MEKKRKVYIVRHHNGSLCTQKQPETASKICDNTARCHCGCCPGPPALKVVKDIVSHLAIAYRITQQFSAEALLIKLYIIVTGYMYAALHICCMSHSIPT